MELNSLVHRHSDPYSYDWQRANQVAPNLVVEQFGRNRRWLPSMSVRGRVRSQSARSCGCDEAGASKGPLSHRTRESFILSLGEQSNWVELPRETPSLLLMRSRKYWIFWQRTWAPIRMANATCSYGCTERRSKDLTAQGIPGTYSAYRDFW